MFVQHHYSRATNAPEYTGALKWAVTRESVKETGVRLSTLVCSLVPLRYHNNIINNRDRSDYRFDTLK